MYIYIYDIYIYIYIGVSSMRKSSGFVESLALDAHGLGHVTVSHCVSESLSRVFLVLAGTLSPSLSLSLSLIGKLYMYVRVCVCVYNIGRGVGRSRPNHLVASR